MAILAVTLWWHAIGLAAMTAGVGEVPAAYLFVARAHDVPPNLFYAVALTESGKASPDSGGLRPWPWTLNIAGSGRFYGSKSEALAVLESSLVQGQRLVDVGPMQVNWHYHEQALGTPGQALDPYRNLQVAARILKHCYAQRGEWWAAVGCYHSPGNKERARKYGDRVRLHWRRLREWH